MAIAQGTSSSLDHLILATVWEASIIRLPQITDEEMEASKGYAVSFPWKYLEAEVRKTDPWAKVASMQT